MTINLLGVFISLSFSLWVHIFYGDVIISISSFFILFPILNIFMPVIDEIKSRDNQVKKELNNYE